MDGGGVRWFELRSAFNLVCRLLVYEKLNWGIMLGVPVVTTSGCLLRAISGIVCVTSGMGGAATGGAFIGALRRRDSAIAAYGLSFMAKEPCRRWFADGAGMPDGTLVGG